MVVRHPLVRMNQLQIRSLQSCGHRGSRIYHSTQYLLTTQKIMHCGDRIFTPTFADTLSEINLNATHRTVIQYSED